MRLSGNAAPPSTGSCSRPCWNASTEQTPISPPWMPTSKRFWPPFADTVARLDEIPGVGPVAAAAILAELGLDMSRFPTPEHLTSWATFAPGIKASVGKIKGNGATGHGNPHLARTLGDLAIGAARTNTFDSAQRTDVRRTGRWWPRGWTRGTLAIAAAAIDTRLPGSPDCVLLMGGSGSRVGVSPGRMEGGRNMAERRSATRPRLGGWPLAVPGVLAAVGCGGLVYQRWATARDRRRLMPPGRLVDAGGHKLHLLIMGEERGGPTIVLEAGGMATSPQWSLIQPGIADFARVVSYDRAGLGWSQPGRAPRDARTIAGELHTALHNAGLPGPYILVGASLGGPYATVFADTYRDEVAGLVLLDSVHPDQLERLPPQARRALAGLRIVNRVLPMLARLGLTHLVDVTGILLAGMPSKLPADAAGQLRTFAHWPGHWAAVDAEVSAWDVTMEQMRRALHGSLRDLPLTVITAPDNPGMEAMREPWLDMQRELASASNSVRHLVLGGVGHVQLATEPEPTRNVIQAVRDIVDLHGTSAAA